MKTIMAASLMLGMFFSKPYLHTVKHEILITIQFYTEPSDKIRYDAKLTRLPDTNEKAENAVDNTITDEMLTYQLVIGNYNKH